MNIQLLQEYVDAALAEVGVRNHGPSRVKARLDKEDPANKAGDARTGACRSGRSLRTTDTRS